ncbi:MAG TPA: hypothetical protein DC049_05835 [Spirochaetia bacterium]|nr:hypothetical protein [Spirochaetia bacterium]
MIQVIDRVAKIIALLQSNRECSLTDTAKHIGVSLQAASNILRTLVHLKWVNVNNSRYSLGEGLLSIAVTEGRWQLLKFICEPAAAALSRETGELVVVACLIDGKRYPIVTSVFNRTIMLNTDDSLYTSPFLTVTGAILFAFANRQEQEYIYNMHGIPKDAWPQIKNKSILMACLTRIKKQGFCIRKSAGKEKMSLAVPIFGTDEKVWASLGILLPAFRYTPGLGKKLLKAMQKHAEEIRKQLYLLEKK